MSLQKLSYRYALSFLLLIQILFFSPFWLSNNVVYHHSNYQQLTGLPDTTDTYKNNPKFADQSTVYIPEINQHLKKSRHNWVSTWNPSVQLGRPTFQLSGFSPAFPLTHLLMRFTQNPFRIYTLLTLATISLTGIFFFLFLKELELSPLACLTSATGLSLSVFAGYWMTFVMFLSTFCWACGLLWLITAFIKRSTFGKGIGISFMTYCLLMTAYPQSVVLMGYIIGIQMFVSFYQKKDRLNKTIWRLVKILLLFLSGAIAAFPAYLDLFLTAQRSARLLVSDEFFLAVLPKITTFKEFTIFLTSLIDPFWWGNPIASDFPLSSYYGLSLSPLYFGLLLVAFSSLFIIRQKGYWHVIIVLCFLGTVWSSAYLFAVHYLGFGLSRSLLLGGSIIPAFILCGYAVEMLSKRDLETKLRRYWSFIVCLSFLVMTFTCVMLSKSDNWQIHWKWAVPSLLISVGLIFFIIFQKKWLLITLITMTAFTYSYRLMLIRPMDSIYTNSPLIDTVRKNTIDGSRFALFGSDISGTLPPNQESLLEIRSINSYDSLSSRNYQDFVSKWSDTGSVTYGRYFNILDNQEKLQDQEFRLSGVSLLLSRQNLQPKSFKQIDEINGIKLYKTPYAPILRLQTPHYKFDALDQSQISLKPPFEYQDTFAPKIIEAFDDYMELQVDSRPEETLLFISQQHHPLWQAIDSQGNTLKTVIVNHFYQGVKLPANTNGVTLYFQPFVLWSWIPQLIYGGLFFFLGFKLTRKLLVVNTSSSIDN